MFVMFLSASINYGRYYLFFLWNLLLCVQYYKKSSHFILVVVFCFATNEALYKTFGIRDLNPKKAFEDVYSSRYQLIQKGRWRLRSLRNISSGWLIASLQCLITPFVPMPKMDIIQLYVRDLERRFRAAAFNENRREVRAN